MTRHCPRCDEEKPLTAFGRDCHAKDGRRVYCKRCATAITKARRARDPERAKARDARYREARREVFRATSRAWDAAHREQRRAAQRDRYAARKADPARHAAFLEARQEKRRQEADGVKRSSAQ